MVLYVMHTDCENDKIWLTSYSSFVNFSYVVWTDCECRELDEVREERLTRWRERDRRERERNYNEERQRRLSCKPLLLSSHFGNGRHNGTSYRLGRRRVNDRNRHAEQREGPRGESIQSPLILLYSVVASIIIYATTHMYTDYTL